MMFGIVLGSIVLFVVVTSVRLLIRDVRTLHHGGRSLADKGGDAAGVTPAAMVWQSNLGAR